MIILTELCPYGAVHNVHHLSRGGLCSYHSPYVTTKFKNDVIEASSIREGFTKWAITLIRMHTKSQKENHITKCRNKGMNMGIKHETSPVYKVAEFWFKNANANIEPLSQNFP